MICKPAKVDVSHPQWNIEYWKYWVRLTLSHTYHYHITFSSRTDEDVGWSLNILEVLKKECVPSHNHKKCAERCSVDAILAGRKCGPSGPGSGSGDWHHSYGQITNHNLYKTFIGKSTINGSLLSMFKSYVKWTRSYSLASIFDTISWQSNSWMIGKSKGPLQDLWQERWFPVFLDVPLKNSVFFCNSTGRQPDLQSHQPGREGKFSNLRPCHVCSERNYLSKSWELYCPNLPNTHSIMLILFEIDISALSQLLTSDVSQAAEHRSCLGWFRYCVVLYQWSNMRIKHISYSVTHVNFKYNWNWFHSDVDPKAQAKCVGANETCGIGEGMKRCPSGAVIAMDTTCVNKCLGPPVVLMSPSTIGINRNLTGSRRDIMGSLMI